MHGSTNFLIELEIKSYLVAIFKTSDRDGKNQSVDVPLQS